MLLHARTTACDKQQEEMQRRENVNVRPDDQGPTCALFWSFFSFCPFFFIFFSYINAFIRRWYTEANHTTDFVVSRCVDEVCSNRTCPKQCLLLQDQNFFLYVRLWFLFFFLTEVCKCSGASSVFLMGFVHTQHLYCFTLHIWQCHTGSAFDWKWRDLVLFQV